MLLYDRLLQVLKAQKEEYMLVYDANANSGSNAGFECTYTTFKIGRASCRERVSSPV